MKESYVEGLAAHNGPESCAGVRKDTGEALTGENTGWVLSRETTTLARERWGSSGVPRWWCHIEGNMVKGATGKARTDPARSQTPRTCGRILHGNRESPLTAAHAWEGLGAAFIEKPDGVRR
jgi:hypothetical protein